MSLAGVRLLARWCPAWRWRESGLRHSCGTGESVSGNIPSGGRGEGASQAVQSREGLSTVAVARWRTGL